MLVVSTAEGIGLSREFVYYIKNSYKSAAKIKSGGKMGRRSELTFFQRRHPDGQQARDKMLTVTHHRGNANGKDDEPSAHAC